MKLLPQFNCFFHHWTKHIPPFPSSSIIPLTFTRHLAVLFFPPNLQTLKTLCSNGRLPEALLEMANLGLEMKFEGYNTLLNACVNHKTLREGQRVHAHMIKTCYQPPVYLRTRLIVFYNKCECLFDAKEVFDEMRERNVVSWTAMISAHSQRGYSSEALNLFVQMLRSGFLGFSVHLVLFV